MNKPSNILDSVESTHYAYDDPALETVMRIHAVKRWHMIETNRSQTLAEHSANVAALVYLCASESGGYFGSPEHACTVSLFHDIPEVFTGDIPSHTKQYLRGVEDLEYRVTPSIFTFEEEPLNLNRLIKLCDLSDGIRFIRLHGVDHTARHARDQLVHKYHEHKMLADSEWPEEVYNMTTRRLNFYAWEDH